MYDYNWGEYVNAHVDVTLSNFDEVCDNIVEQVAIVNGVAADAVAECACRCGAVAAGEASAAYETHCPVGT